MFGGTTSNNNWNASTGFGAKTANTTDSTNKPTTSLFGNSTQQSGGLFGNTLNTGNSSLTTGGLFGNSSNNKPAALTGGLFGNSSNQTTSLTGGLFGNSNTNTTGNTGGLFGNSSTNTTLNTGGLFGNSNSNSNATNNTGGLFGNSNTNTTLNTGGLFGNSNTTQPAALTGGLFGNSNTNATTNTGGLFGNSNTNTTGNTGGLFGNSSTNATLKTGGLFGNTQNLNTGLNSNSASLFNNSSAASNLNADPYNAKQIFANINRDQNTLPRSITENLYANDANKDPNSKKRKYSYLEKPDNKKSSLLYRLGQTLKIFRNTNSSYNPIRGLFRPANYLNIDGGSKKRIPKIIEVNKGTFQPSKRALLNNSQSGSMKRLIIKSKPLKFHLINADKVFNSKRRRVVTNVILSDKILSEKLSSDEEDDDEDDIEIKSKFSKPQENKVMVGESVNVDELVEETRESFDHGYWCSPPLKHLLQLPQDDLSSIEHFIVGRDGYFQVAYDFRVDLNDIIKLALENGTTVDKQLFGKNKVFNMTKHGQLEVYLNYQTAKPALGSGLNVPATITLEDIKPSSGSTAQDLIRKLRNQTGQEFLTYDPIKYTWTFRVKHFSVWGLIDEDNEELMAIKRKQDDQEESTMMEYTKIYESDKYEQELKKQKLSEFSSVLPGGWGYNAINAQLPLVAKRDSVAKEVKNRINSYKPDEVKDILPVESDLESVTSEMLNSETAPIRHQNQSFEYLHQMVSSLPRGTNYKEIVDEKAYEPEIDNTSQFDRIQFKPDLPVSKDWLVQLELANDIDSPLVPAQAQKGQKVTLETIDDMLFNEFNKESLAFNQSSTPTKPRKKEESDKLINKKDVMSFIEEMITRANFKKRSNGYPILAGINHISFANLIPLSLDDDQKVLLKLGSALFDDGFIEKELLDINKEDTELQEHVKQITRKRAFGEWLRKYNKEIIKPYLEKSKNDDFEYSFLRVCSGDLDGAVDKLIKTRNNHLSAILPLLDSNEDAVISIATKQLEDWQDQGIMSSIPAGCVKIYKLLAREFSTILLDLPWSIGLGVQLFYGDNSIKLSDLIKAYVPAEENNAVIDMLVLYNKIQQQISIDEFKSSSMNLKLLWIFNIVLSNNGQITFSNDTLSQEFGDYLTKNELSKEASFVYTTLHQDEDSKKSQRNLIFTNIDSIFLNNDDSLLVSILRLPQSLIFEAIAHKKYLKQDYWAQCQSLLDAKLWDEAHTTIVQQLGPQTIISNKQDLKQKLLETIDQFPESGSVVPDWNKGAGIYHAYINLADSTDNLNFLLTNLPHVKDKSTFLISTALKIISRTVGDLAMEKLPNVTKSKIMELVLSESDRQYFTLRLA